MNRYLVLARGVPSPGWTRAVPAYGIAAAIRACREYGTRVLGICNTDDEASPDTCKESAPDLTRPGDVPKRLPHV